MTNVNIAKKLRLRYIRIRIRYIHIRIRFMHTMLGLSPNYSYLRTTSATLCEDDHSDECDNRGAHGDYGYRGDHN